MSLPESERPSENVQALGAAVPPAEVKPQVPSFEELTLAEAAGQLIRSPRATLAALARVAQSKREPAVFTPAPLPLAPIIHTTASAAERLPKAVDQREVVRFGLRIAAFLTALWGSNILHFSPSRTEAAALDVGAPFLLVAFLVWLIAEFYGDWPNVHAWQTRRHIDHVELKMKHEPWAGIHPARVFMGLGGLFCSFVALRFTSDNQFTFVGFWSWMLSILLWVAALAPSGWGVLPALTGLRVRWRDLRAAPAWIVISLLLIMLLGAVFRLSNLPDNPPEMTSDHVEKILDSQNVLNGVHQVFFPNNGGREGFQMYAMALFSQLPGLGMNFTTLKLLSALEGLIAVLAMYWLGREAIGADDRRLGNLVGLLLAALVAASYWHTALSRLGLRIVLTTLVTALLLIFLARAMRYNRRDDYIKAGLVLGFGLYMYQAVRMLPLVAVIGIGLGLLFHARGWRERGRYLLNGLVLVVVSFVVFVPLFGYFLNYPEDFLRRTSGRLFGDDVIQETNAEGQIVERNASLQERITAFNNNLPQLANNMRNAVLMFNWKGDVAWINAAPNRPAMDIYAGSLLIVGLAAWLARMIRRRDAFDWLVPLALLVMLLPSALSIAYPVENPSHTRTSGALPEAYLIAALPLALIAQQATRVLHGRFGTYTALGLVLLAVVGGYSLNSSLYFNDYRVSYLDSSLPYTEAGRILRGFAESDGSYGNAFMIAYPYWWDHRALGLEAGRTDWPNGIVSLNDVPNFLFLASQKTGLYRFDPEQDILFFYAAEDDEAQIRLEQWFPEGRWQERMSYQGDDSYRLYRVPALGQVGFEAWLDDNLQG